MPRRECPCTAVLHNRLKYIDGKYARLKMLKLRLFKTWNLEGCQDRNSSRARNLEYV